MCLHTGGVITSELVLLVAFPSIIETLHIVHTRHGRDIYQTSV